MTTTRDRIAAQDQVIASLIAASKAQDAPAAVSAEIRAIAASLAKKWGIAHADLPDTRRTAQ